MTAKVKSKTAAKSSRDQLVQSFDCLKTNPLFLGLSNEELSIFKDTAKTVIFKKNKIVFLQQRPAEHFYIICSGWIKLFFKTPSKEKIIIDMLSSGDLLGETTFLERSIHKYSAQVIEDALVLKVPSEVMKQQLSRSPTFALNMLACVSRHTRLVCHENAMNARLGAPQRIGHFLLRWFPANKKVSAFFHLPYNKNLIALSLGMNIATFSRALNVLRQETGIRIIGSRIEIDSVESLTKFVYDSPKPK